MKASPQRLREVLLDAEALLVADAELHLRVGMALRGGLAQPDDALGGILGTVAADELREAELVLHLRVLEIGELGAGRTGDRHGEREGDGRGARPLRRSQHLRNLADPAPRLRQSDS